MNGNQAVVAGFSKSVNVELRGLLDELAAAGFGYLQLGTAMAALQQCGFHADKAIELLGREFAAKPGLVVTPAVWPTCPVSGEFL